MHDEVAETGAQLGRALPLTREAHRLLGARARARRDVGKHGRDRLSEAMLRERGLR